MEDCWKLVGDKFNGNEIWNVRGRSAPLEALLTLKRGLMALREVDETWVSNVKRGDGLKVHNNDWKFNSSAGSWNGFLLSETRNL
ncbi:MAG: hypothetical protein ACTS5F_01990 [Candidatus Hodgkinia cicadicola]